MKKTLKYSVQKSPKGFQWHDYRTTQPTPVAYEMYLIIDRNGIVRVCGYCPTDNYTKGYFCTGREQRNYDAEVLYFACFPQAPKHILDMLRGEESFEDEA